MSGSRQRAILAYLALLPSHACERERLSGLFWSEADARSARQNLRQTLLRLKRDLDQTGHELVLTDREVVKLRIDAIEVDVDAFSRLAASGDIKSMSKAINLYGGHFLDGLTLEEEAFDEWVSLERARIKVIFRALIERYIAHPDVPGAQAVAVANRLVSFDFFDESAQRLLLRMLATHSGGQAALTHADQFARQLHKELGVLPDDESRALIAKIRAETAKSGSAFVISAHIRAPRNGASVSERTPLFQSVPPRDMNFTGRSAVLTTIRKFLTDAGDPIVAKQVAIHGMGGIGKSSLAAEYAHRYAKAYSGIWWAPAGQRATLVNSLALLASKLDGRFAEEADQEKAATAGLAQLSMLEKPLLLIYDDAQSPDALTGLVPPVGGHVIVTSRWADWSGRAAELKLNAFEEDMATEFLQKRAARNDPDGARRLASALGYLPLALDHAGAYCRVTGSSFEDYAPRIDALVKQAPRAAAYPASIAATLGLAIDVAAQQSPDAATLLGLTAFLSPERIPIELFSGAGFSDDERASALAALYGVSLIEYEMDETPAISVHPLVQAAMRVRLAEQDDLPRHIRKVATALAGAFPDSALIDPTKWQRCAMLLRHVLAYRQSSGASPDISKEAASLFYSAASYLQMRGSYQEAESLYRDAISIGESALSRQHQTVADIQNGFALLLSTTGRYAEAEPLLRKTIASGQRALGRRHLSVAVRLNNLARLLSDTKRYAEAEPLYREAIAIADSQANSEYPYALAWRNNLGILLNETDRNIEGEQLYREALALGERTLDRRHHEMARCLNNLGRLLGDLGQWPEAITLVREALSIWNELLGDYHPLTARGQHNLAMTLLGLGEKEDAVAAAESALFIHENTLGAGHFWTEASARTCIDAYKAVGQFEKANELLRRYKLFSLVLPAED